MPTNPSLTFKRLTIGQRFRDSAVSLDVRLGTFRKVGPRHAYLLNANGIGQTHARVPFNRNRAVVVAA